MGRRKLVFDCANCEERVRDFMEWYAVHMGRAHTHAVMVAGVYNEDLLSDAMLRVCAALSRGTEVRSYICYFVKAYQATIIDDARACKKYRERELIEEIDTAPKEDSDRTYNEWVGSMVSEILSYVRRNYKESEAILFEIYVGLAPATSYKKLAALLGIPHIAVWEPLGRIKKGILLEFGSRCDFFLSESEM